MEEIKDDRLIKIDLDFKVDMQDEKANKVVYALSQCIGYQFKINFDFMVNLYKLKLFFTEKHYHNYKCDCADKSHDFDYLTFDSNTVRTIIYQGFPTEFTYYKLCSELFNLDRKTIEKYNQFSKYYITNLNFEVEGYPPKFSEEIFYKMSISKLLELNPLYVWQTIKLIEIGVINEKCTVEQIRAIVKRVKELGSMHTTYSVEDFLPNEEEEKEEVKEEIPEFNIDNDYNLFDFKVFPKKDLTMIAFDCYQAYRSVKKEIAKLKDKNKSKTKKLEEMLIE